MAAPASSAFGNALALRQGAEQLSAALPPLLVEADRVATTVAQGVHGRRRVGTGDAFWQYRRYQPGDPAAVIDWRQSAKRDVHFVRQNEWEAAESVWLWRDGSPSMVWRSARAPVLKRDRATVLLLALATLLVRGGERVGLLGLDRLPTSSRATLDRMARTLVSDGAMDVDSVPPSADLPRFAHLVVIGDFLAPLSELEPRIRAYAAAGVAGHLLQVIDPAEQDLPFRGRTRFEGLEGERGFIIGKVESLKQDWNAKLQRRHDALKTIAQRAGWSFSVHRTDRPPQTALLALYAALAGGLHR
jgi:uncharacterized protein (DUF58 family)